MALTPESSEPAPRPDGARRLTFEDIAIGWAPEVLERVVPLEQARPGVAQVAVHSPLGDGLGGAPMAPQSLDALADLPEVESIVGAGRVVATRPLPNVRELSVTEVDEETLANLPNLRMLDVRQGPGRRVLDVEAVPDGVRDLCCDARRTFGSLEAVARLSGLERLRADFAYECSMKPLAQLSGLRWLIADVGKDVRALGQLEQLELVSLELESASLANLKPFGAWTRVRRLDIDGRRLKSLVGIEAMTALERLRLYRPGIPDLSSLHGHRALRELELHHADKITDWPPLELPALRRLTIELEAPAQLPTLAFLRGCEALEEVTLIGPGAADRDPSPIGGLPSLRAFSFYGDYPPEAVAAVRAARPRASIDWQPPFDSDPAGRPREPLTPSELPDGSWTLYEDVSGILGLDSNHDAEDLVRATLRASDPELHERLAFDSEGSAFSVAGSEGDVRAVAELIRRLAPA